MTKRVELINMNINKLMELVKDSSTVNEFFEVTRERLREDYISILCKALCMKQLPFYIN
jgi:hypothetical protein